MSQHQSGHDMHELIASAQNPEHVNAAWVLMSAQQVSPQLHKTYAAARLEHINAILAFDSADAAQKNLLPYGNEIQRTQHQVSQALADLIQSVTHHSTDTDD